MLDKLTYAGRLESLQDLMTYERMEFLQGDICDPVAVRGALEGCDAIVNFAAESHVDRSIEEPGHFIQTDVYGTYVLLEEARRAGVERYLQVSTDEVYGSIEEGSFTEQSPLDPSSPYSASKAGGDLVVGAYFHTFGIDAVVCRASNNYGPYQYPEKLIPLCILNALHGDPLPVYGDGMQVRNWLHVTDHCSGLDTVLREGNAGETYNIGGPDELPNIDVVHKILELTGRDESLIEHVNDRLGHDRRYSLASEKMTDLGWAAEIRFEEGLAFRVDWYRDNPWWWEPIRTGRLPRVLPAPVRPEAAVLDEIRHGFSAHRDAHRRAGPGRARRVPGFAAGSSRDVPCRRVREARASIASSCRTTTRARSGNAIRAFHFQLRPVRRSWCARRAERSRTWRSTCAATPPPTGNTRPSSSATRTTASCSCRSASHTASASSSDVADVTYKVSSYYDGATERGIAFDDPELGVEWPVDEPLVSDRDRANPRLSEIADQLPW